MTEPKDDREGLAAFMLRLRGRGIADKRLVEAFEATPRRNFVSSQWQSAAWSERMVPIECGETIEGVDLQAAVISSLKLEPGCRVLEIGTGSGYSAAVMSRLVSRVVTLERYRTLAELSQQRLTSLGIENVIVRHADGSAGLPAESPFDRIVVWAAFDSLPRSFVEQLSTAGIMVAPIGAAEEQQALCRLSKVGSRFEREDIARVRLQPIERSLAKVI